MTLDEFIAGQHVTLHKFREHWMRQRERHPNSTAAWPLDMDPGDWDDQLASFPEYLTLAKSDE